MGDKVPSSRWWAWQSRRVKLVRNEAEVREFADKWLSANA